MCLHIFTSAPIENLASLDAFRNQFGAPAESVVPLFLYRAPRVASGAPERPYRRSRLPKALARTTVGERLSWLTDTLRWLHNDGEKADWTAGDWDRFFQAVQSIIVFHGVKGESIDLGERLLAINLRQALRALWAQDRLRSKGHLATFPLPPPWVGEQALDDRAVLMNAIFLRTPKIALALRALEGATPTDASLILSFAQMSEKWQDALEKVVVFADEVAPSLEALRNQAKAWPELAGSYRVLVESIEVVFGNLWLDNALQLLSRSKTLGNSKLAGEALSRVEKLMAEARAPAD
jgi:hypothetical protein